MKTQDALRVPALMAFNIRPGKTALLCHHSVNAQFIIEFKHRTHQPFLGVSFEVERGKGDPGVFVDSHLNQVDALRVRIGTHPKDLNFTETPAPELVKELSSVKKFAAAHNIPIEELMVGNLKIHLTAAAGEDTFAFTDKEDRHFEVFGHTDAFYHTDTDENSQFLLGNGSLFCGLTLQQMIDAADDGKMWVIYAQAGQTLGRLIRFAKNKEHPENLGFPPGLLTQYNHEIAFQNISKLQVGHDEDARKIGTTANDSWDHFEAGFLAGCLAETVDLVEHAHKLENTALSCEVFKISGRDDMLYLAITLPDDDSIEAFRAVLEQYHQHGTPCTVICNARQLVEQLDGDEAVYEEGKTSYHAKFVDTLDFAADVFLEHSEYEEVLLLVQPDAEDGSGIRESFDLNTTSVFLKLPSMDKQTKQRFKSITRWRSSEFVLKHQVDGELVAVHDEHNCRLTEDDKDRQRDVYATEEATKLKMRNLVAGSGVLEEINLMAHNSSIQATTVMEVLVAELGPYAQMFSAYMSRLLHIGSFQAPPGSGKTRVLVILSLMQAVARGQKVAICSHTNAAVNRVMDEMLSITPGMINKINSQLRSSAEQPVISHVHVDLPVAMVTAPLALIATDLNEDLSNFIRIVKAKGSVKGVESNNPSDKWHISGSVCEWMLRLVGVEGFPMPDNAPQNLIDVASNILTGIEFTNLRAFVAGDMTWEDANLHANERSTTAPRVATEEELNLPADQLIPGDDEDKSQEDPCPPIKKAVKAMFEAVVSMADIVMSTTGFCTNKPWTGFLDDADILIIDTAGSLSVPDALIAWRKPVTPLVLFGDTRQLPPWIRKIWMAPNQPAQDPAESNVSEPDYPDGAPTGDTGGLKAISRLEPFMAISILEWFSNRGVPGIRLSFQFRAVDGAFDHLLDLYYHKSPFTYHPSRASLYDPLARKVEDLMIAQFPEITPSPDGKVLPLLLHVEASTTKITPSKSKTNSRQVGAAVSLATQIISATNITAADVLIVSPYKACVKDIKFELSSANLEEVTTMTADSSQGHEAKVVIVVMATTKDSGTGFTKANKRNVVLLSRHRAFMLIVTDINTVPCNFPWEEEVEEEVEAVIATEEVSQTEAVIATENEEVIETGNDNSGIVVNAADVKRTQKAKKTTRSVQEVEKNIIMLHEWFSKRGRVAVLEKGDSEYQIQLPGEKLAELHTIWSGQDYDPSFHVFDWLSTGMVDAIAHSDRKAILLPQPNVIDAVWQKALNDGQFRRQAKKKLAKYQTENPGAIEVALETDFTDKHVATWLGAKAVRQNEIRDHTKCLVLARDGQLWVVGKSGEVGFDRACQLAESWRVVKFRISCQGQGKTLLNHAQNNGINAIREVSQSALVGIAIYGKLRQKSVNTYLVYGPEANIQLGIDAIRRYTETQAIVQADGTFWSRQISAMGGELEFPDADEGGGVDQGNGGTGGTPLW